MLAGIARFAGLGVALVALVRETLLFRAPGTLPIARLVQRELRVKPPASHLAICVAAGILLAAAPVGWSIALGTTALSFEPQWRSAAILAVVGTVVVKVLWVFFEELAFRAALITSLARRIGIPAAVAISALAFAAAHGRDATSAAILVTDGIGFAVAYVASRSIRGPIAWHASKNLTVWVLTGQSTMQFAPSPLRLIGGGPSAVVELSAAVLIVGLASLALWRFRSAEVVDQLLGDPGHVA